MYIVGTPHVPFKGRSCPAEITKPVDSCSGVPTINKTTQWKCFLPTLRLRPHCGSTDTNHVLYYHIIHPEKNRNDKMLHELNPRQARKCSAQHVDIHVNRQAARKHLPGMIFFYSKSVSMFFPFLTPVSQPWKSQKRATPLDQERSLRYFISISPMPPKRGTKRQFKIYSSKAFKFEVKPQN